MKKLSLISFMFLIVIMGCEKSGSEAAPSSSDGNTGLAGSMSKFTFSGNYLYVVQNQLLNVYNTANSASPKLIKTINLQNNGVETIFADGNYLFFGTRNGLLIYSINNPEIPSYVSTYTHVVSCDPVVVKGDLAYVTLSSGTVCGRGVNQLEVIDISNITHPQLMNTYSFTNPKGMAISGNYLYLCDAVSGLLVLDITDNEHIEVKSSISSLPCNDVIVKGNRLTITAKSGIYQYDCTDPLNLKFISKINAQ